MSYWYRCYLACRDEHTEELRRRRDELLLDGCSMPGDRVELQEIESELRRRDD